MELLQVQDLHLKLLPTTKHHERTARLLLQDKLMLPPSVVAAKKADSSEIIHSIEHSQRGQTPLQEDDLAT